MTVEDRFADLLPEVMLGVDAAAFADIAAAAFTPRPVPTVGGTEHLHASQVSVPEQAELLLEFLSSRGGAGGQWASFKELVADCEAPIQIVGRSWRCSNCIGPGR